MFGVNWSDPQTLWLNLTNLALGLICLAAILVVAFGVGRELMLRRRRIREVDGLEAEMNAMLHAGDAHMLSVPGLGLTMADGGEPIQPPAKPDGERK